MKMVIDWAPANPAKSALKSLVTYWYINSNNTGTETGMLTYKILFTYRVT